MVGPTCSVGPSWRHDGTEDIEQRRRQGRRRRQQQQCHCVGHRRNIECWGRVRVFEHCDGGSRYDGRGHARSLGSRAPRLRLASISTVHPTFLRSRCRRPWWRGSRAARLHPRREVTKRPRSGLSRAPLDRRVPEGRQPRSSAQPAAVAKLAVRPPCPARARHVRIALVRAASLKHALCALWEHTAAAGRLVPSRASAGRRGAHALRGRAPLMAACPRLPVTTLWRALGTWRWRVPWGTQARRAGLASPRAAARAQPHPATSVGWHQRLAAASFALSAHFVWAELRLLSSVDARSTRTAPPVPQMTGPARRALRVFRVPAVPQRLSSPHVPPPSR